MFASLRGWLVGGVAAILVCGVLASASQAAPPVRVLPNSTTLVNPYWQVAPGLSLRQYAYNQRVLANVYTQYPPWVFGYNPYPAPVIYNAYSPYVLSPYYYNPYFGY
jgi:hypothetical protein